MRKHCPDYSALAQLVEQLTVNQRVAGSSPAGGANSKMLTVFLKDIIRSNFSPKRNEALAGGDASAANAISND